MYYGISKRRRRLNKKRIVLAVVSILFIIFTIIKLTNFIVKYMRKSKQQFISEKSLIIASSPKIKFNGKTTGIKDKNNLYKLNMITVKSKISDKDFFNQDVFLGDSITESMSYYNVLKPKNVLGIRGMTVIKAKEKVGTLKKLNPRNIYILFGANDLEGGISLDQFLKDYSELVKLIKNQIPNVKIYAQSVLYVRADKAKQNKYLTKQRIDNINDSLKKMIQNQGGKYININPIVENSKKDYYEPDGIHVIYDFYPVWAKLVRAKI
ncbi:hypothetical protein C3495_03590 [Clostridiaceae bacterium 14S0207]|nr:hypothetical protein C3495_03590 [Clostridiaceae bacterium 14S0207]